MQALPSTPSAAPTAQARARPLQRREARRAIELKSGFIPWKEGTKNIKSPTGPKPLATAGFTRVPKQAIKIDTSTAALQVAATPTYELTSAPKQAVETDIAAALKAAATPIPATDIAPKQAASANAAEDALQAPAIRRPDRGDRKFGFGRDAAPQPGGKPLPKLALTNEEVQAELQKIARETTDIDDLSQIVAMLERLEASETQPGENAAKGASIDQANLNEGGLGQAKLRTQQTSLAPAPPKAPGKPGE